MLDKKFFQKILQQKNETCQSDVTSSVDDVIITDDNVTITNSDVNKKATPNKGAKDKTPDSTQDLGETVLAAVM